MDAKCLSIRLNEFTLNTYMWRLECGLCSSATIRTKNSVFQTKFQFFSFSINYTAMDIAQVSSTKTIWPKKIGACNNHGRKRELWSVDSHRFTNIIWIIWSFRMRPREQRNFPAGRWNHSVRIKLSAKAGVWKQSVANVHNIGIKAAIFVWQIHACLLKTVSF